MKPNHNEGEDGGTLYGEAARARERELALAVRLSGEAALPLSRQGLVALSLEQLCRHVLVLGATGSGKTETLLRLAWGVAKGSGARVWYLDGKGDTQTAERFRGAMRETGREAMVFPHQPLDGWRGERHELAGRLMEVVDYAREGPAAWYRDVAKAVVGLVCEHPDGPPRGSRDVLERMDVEALAKAYPGSRAVAALSELQVRQVRLRYEAFFGQTRGMLDGTWSWGDAQAGYLLLDGLALREETAGVARFLMEDFAQWFSRRKPREEWCVMIVDEFSTLAGAMAMATRVEQARGFNTALVLAPQVLAGMGSESETARILGSVETVVCHRVNTPERVIELAGTRRRNQFTMRYAGGGATGEGTTRQAEEPKIDANRVRGLRPGEAFVIRKGMAMRARVLRAPPLRAPLPEQQLPEQQPQAMRDVAREAVADAAAGNGLPF
jgi:hypothetical protein